MQISEYDIFLYVAAPAKVSKEKTDYITDHFKLFEPQIEYMITLTSSLNNPIPDSIKQRLRNCGRRYNENGEAEIQD
jgi:hypothetical protein